MTACMLCPKPPISPKYILCAECYAIIYPDWSIRFRRVAKRRDKTEWIGYVTHKGVEREVPQ